MPETTFIAKVPAASEQERKNGNDTKIARNASSRQSKEQELGSDWNCSHSTNRCGGRSLLPLQRGDNDARDTHNDLGYKWRLPPNRFAPRLRIQDLNWVDNTQRNIRYQGHLDEHRRIPTHSNELRPGPSNDLWDHSLCDHQLRVRGRVCLSDFTSRQRHILLHIQQDGRIPLLLHNPRLDARYRKRTIDQDLRANFPSFFGAVIDHDRASALASLSISYRRVEISLNLTRVLH